MKVEIERKFLVDKIEFSKVFGKDRVSVNKIKQGYLYNRCNHSVRVRKSSNGPSTLTYKGKLLGCTRPEREFNLWTPIASILLLLCGKVISKTRFTVKEYGERWEVDVFHNLKEPLILAEIELHYETYTPYKPVWLGEEVTYDSRYYNVNLTKIVV